MKRAGRYLLNAVTVLSLFLAIGFTVIWASRLLPRPWQIPLSLRFRANATYSFELFAGFNYIYLTKLEYNKNPIEGPPPPQLAEVTAFENRFAKQSVDHDYRGLAINSRRRPIFFQTASTSRIAMVGSLNMVGIGFGYFPLLFLLLPLARLPAAIRWAKERYGRKPGQCHKCGYDVRASSERCPECGTPIAVAGSIWM